VSNQILVIEDELDIARLIRHCLEREGYGISIVSDGTRGLTEAIKRKPELIILDLLLPGMDGLEICRKIRIQPETAQIPLIMLTAKGEVSDKVVGLELGADDYLTKPFSPRELVARVRSLMRRNRLPQSAPTLRHGKITLDPIRHEVRIGPKEVILTAKEFSLLELLLKNQGRVLTREVLLNTVWGYDYFGTTRTIDVHVRRLREKIPPLSDALITVKSLGYKIKDEP